MAQVIWTSSALTDLEDIAEYISLDSREAASTLIENVFTSIEHLGLFPNSGRKPPEIQDSIYREKVVGPCRIFCRIQKEDVVIIYVMRSERELRRYVLDKRY
jgi:toxin ParE1/3/4